LVGAGGHARSCIDVIELSGQYKVAGLIVKNEKNEQENLEYPIIEINDDLQALPRKYIYALIIGWYR